MSPETARQHLRVALVHHTFGEGQAPDVDRATRELALALRDRGHDARVISSRRGLTRRAGEDGIPVIRSGRLPEAPMRFRGFAGPLTHLPLTVRELARGRYDVAQAFSAIDAEALLQWRRITGRPVVFSSAEPLVRQRLADRRLRLRLVSRAVSQSDAVVACTLAAQAALGRWLGVQAEHLEPGDAAGHEQMYRALLERE